MQSIFFFLENNDNKWNKYLSDRYLIKGVACRKRERERAEVKAVSNRGREEERERGKDIRQSVSNRGREKKGEEGNISTKKKEKHLKSNKSITTDMIFYSSFEVLSPFTLLHE